MEKSIKSNLDIVKSRKEWPLADIIRNNVYRNGWLSIGNYTIRNSNTWEDLSIGDDIESNEIIGMKFRIDSFVLSNICPDSGELDLMIKSGEYILCPWNVKLIN